ncbi:hypothetical protein KEM52_000139 [Ascosphaera acerosa]|nr:hypothetical protein KEM52_000139 [Ascosphaera acerosa]
MTYPADYGTHEVLTALASWIAPLKGMRPYNKKLVEESKLACTQLFALVERHLTANQFLVGERLSLADYFLAALLPFGFGTVLDEAWRNANPAVFRWFETVAAQPAFKAAVPEVVFCETALENVPPKKEEKAKKEEKPKPAAAAPPAAPAADAPAPKPKHPLEALGKPTLILDDWKREYSNNETRETAMPWFWEHYTPEEYSLWKVDYKYNDELKLVFMSNNLIGGFFARLEASRKYIFGAASVYGQNSDSVIQGAFMIRGQESTPAFDVAPDWESYSFTKLDHTSEDDRKFVENMWAQDVGIKVGDKEYEWADGRVFK